MVVHDDDDGYNINSLNQFFFPQCNFYFSNLITKKIKYCLSCIYINI